MGVITLKKKEDGSPYKVLIIDDSLFVVKQLTKMLEPQGVEIVAFAYDGEKGLEKYKALYPNIDLVFLDIKMPNSDGVETLKNILDFDKSAKILMISAYGCEDIIKKTLLIGAKDFITKPIKQDKIISKIQQILSKK